MILTLLMQHLGLMLHKMYINYDPGLTLAYFTAMSNLDAYMYVFELGKRFLTGKTQQMTILTKDLCF